MDINTNSNEDQNILAGKKVGLMYSEVKREYFPTEAAFITEETAFEDAQIIANYVRKLDMEPVFYPGEPESFTKIQNEHPDVVVNLVGSVKGIDSLAAAIPGVLAILGVPYTGAEMLGESLAYNKFLVKKLLQQLGVPVPNYQLFVNYNDPISSDLRFPLISKLNEIHGAVEITGDSVSENERHLRERLKYLMKTYKQPVLVEEFIVGREVTAFVLEGLNKKVYLGEKVFNKPNEKYIFATFDDQWNDCDAADKSQWPYDYAKYEDPVLREYVKRAYDACKMKGYGKFDVRVDASNRYYFIDSNSNPALGPMESGCGISYVLNMYGIGFTEILRRILINALNGKPSTFGNGSSEQQELLEA